MSENDLMDELPHTVERIQSLDTERVKDCEMAWEDYLCYVLEVDREDVNEDGLGELAIILSRLGEYTRTDN